MEIQKIRYGKYELTIGDNGFYLKDLDTDEVVVDGSQLQSDWPVEISISETNRNFYFSNTKSPDIVFGFSQSRP